MKQVQKNALNAFLDKKIVHNKEALALFMSEFDNDLIHKNLSPGGSADLLAVTCFLFDYFSNSKYFTKFS